MFVQEDLWKSLDKSHQASLGSVVMGVEAWLQKKIQLWNRDRMIIYCREMLALVEENLRLLEYRFPKLLHNPSISTPYPSVESTPSKALVTVENEAMNDQEIRNSLSLLLECVPKLPQDTDCVSSGTVRATAVATGMQKTGQPDVPWPFYLINTRDCFRYDLIEVKKLISIGERQFIKTDFYFQADQVPEDYGVQRNAGSGFVVRKAEMNELLPLEKTMGSGMSWQAVDGYPSEAPPGAVAVGVTTFSSFFSHAELSTIEAKADEVHQNSEKGLYPPECFHPTVGKNGALKRTKYFFGARYLWTKEQLADHDACVAKGVRVDVPPNPLWMKGLVEDELVSSAIVPKGFINSWALNMYHDGSEGIQSHFDDSQRFCQPIYSMRLFSDSRLSFGTQLYGFTNGAFYVPMPRGCITIMHDKSYAANAVKHCVRPCDMTGKSAGLIMRKINKEAWKEAVQYHLNETISWLEQLQIDDDLDLIKSTRLKGIKGEMDDGAKQHTRKHLQVQADVKSVMDGLLKSVTKSLNQEEMTEKKLRKAETRAAKQTLIKGVEGAEKQALKEMKQRQQQISQIESLLENLIKKIEVDAAPSKRKRRDNSASSSSTDRGKQEKSDNEQKPPFTYQSVIQAANHILENVIGKKHGKFVQTVCSLLNEHGPSWIHILRQEEMESKIEQASSSGSTEVDQIKTQYPASASEDQSVPASPEPKTLPFVLSGLQQGNVTFTPGPGTFPVLCRPAAYFVPAVPHDIVLAKGTEQQTVNLPTLKDLGLAVGEVASFIGIKNLSTSELEEEPKKLASSLVTAVLRQAVSALPAMMKGQSFKLSEQGLPVEVLQKLAQEAESVNIGSFSSGSIPSAEVYKRPQRGLPKRRYRLVPAEVCFGCEKPGYDPQTITNGAEMTGDPLWSCQGKCRRSFHFQCLQPSSSGKCPDCESGVHHCHQCQEGTNGLGNVMKCSMGVCGRYYHVPCVMQIPETRVLHGTWIPVGSISGDATCMKFRCPLHYCKACGKSGANVLSVTCIRCPTAYHSR